MRPLREGLGWALACLLATVVRADVVPARGSTDGRVRTVVYDAAQVYRLQGFAGIAIHLQFAPGEVFQGIGGGDLEAVSFVAQSNHLFLKPKATKVATNLTLLTNRRTYHFDYTVGGRKPDPAVDEVIYSLEFQYPGDVAAEAESRAEAQRISTALAQLPTRTLNRDYGFCGPKVLRPSEAFDDGIETRLRFPSRVDLPAVFVRNEDGSESLVNFTVESDALVLHRIAKAFVLRRGKLVGCIVNEHFEGGGTTLPSGTLAPTVQRVSLGALP